MGRIKFEGTVVGDLFIKEYLGKKNYLTVCTKCGAEEERTSQQLIHKSRVICGSSKPDMKDIVGKQFSEWTVLSYEGDKKYLCKCSCGVEKLVERGNLLKGTSKSCGHWHKKYGNLVGKRFGEWEVLRKVGANYECKCSCGKVAIKTSSDLTSGKSRSCGHDYNTFIDISGQKFGLWNVLEYLGNQYYLCECSCKNRTRASVRKADLLSGATKSCGCAKGELAKQSRLERYGDPGPNRATSPRTPEQISAIENKNNLEEFIYKLNDPELTPLKLSEKLGIQISRTLTLLHKYDLVHTVKLYATTSYPEHELIEFIRSNYSGEIVRRDRNILSGQELDIYLPELKLAIEFNGSYWHSTEFKDKDYHLLKSVSCGKMGIELIHIFEYEWNNIDTKEKVKIYLLNKILKHIKIYARKLEVKEVGVSDVKGFIDKYHLQGYSNSKINIVLIEPNSQEIQGVMTFGKPRFDRNAEYELIRLCYRPGLTVVGGTQKLFTYFLRKYSPSSIITYADLAKFNGNTYLHLGFKLINGSKIEPNYVWFNPANSTILSRYQCQKHKLLESGLGEYGDTEDSIMHNIGYLKIYDAGQLKFLYTCNKDNN